MNALKIRGRSFDWGSRTYIMGVVNVTPDSFSGDGRSDANDAIARAVEQHKFSSDILDIGAESTRPGHVPVDERVERERLLPVVRGVRNALPDAVISVDTYKPGVLRAAVAEGADMLNSVWGLPDELLEAAADLRVPVAIMHNKSEASYGGNVMDEVLSFLQDAGERAMRAGIPREAILLDPGIGFGKTPEHNIEVLRELRRLPSLGFPTLLGTSRKSTIGKLTGRTQPQERLFGTAATTALAVAARIDVVRVHDVAETRDVISVADAIERNWRPDSWM
jgi:dihydropteroate synthase